MSVVVPMEIHIEILRTHVATILLPEIWERIVTPYLGRIHNHYWLLPDSTRSSPQTQHKLLAGWH